MALRGTFRRGDTAAIRILDSQVFRSRLFRDAAALGRLGDAVVLELVAEAAGLD